MGSFSSAGYVYSVSPWCRLVHKGSCSSSLQVCGSRSEIEWWQVLFSTTPGCGSRSESKRRWVMFNTAPGWRNLGPATVWSKETLVPPSTICVLGRYSCTSPSDRMCRGLFRSNQRLPSASKLHIIVGSDSQNTQDVNSCTDSPTTPS